MKTWLILTFSLWLTANYSFAQHQLESYLAVAAKHNPELKTRFNEYLAAMEDIPQAKALPDPQVTFGIFVQPIETRVGAQRASVALNQSFPWFGTLKAQGNVAALRADAKLKLFEDKKNQVFKNIRLSYNQLYFLSKSIALTQQNLQLLASFKELARVNFESGKTGFVNVLRVEMEEQELNAALAYLVDSKQVELKKFEKLLNTSLGTIPTFAESLPVLNLAFDKQAIYDSILDKNAILSALRIESEAHKGQVKVAQLMGKPSFTVGTNYVNVSRRNGVDISDNGKDAFLFPQIGLKIPLFKTRYRAMEKQTVLLQEGVEHQIEQQSNELHTTMEVLIRDHIDAQRRLNLYISLNDLAERSLSLLQTEFTTGTSDFEEVLRVERKLLTYQLESERARIDNNNAIAEIDYLMGK